MTEYVPYLEHYGTPRESGRYPWGSGENPYQNNMNFLGMVKDLRGKGMTDTEIAKGMGFKSTTEFRAANSIIKNEVRAADHTEAQKLKAKGLSNVAIGQKMGLNESSVRALLDPAAKARQDVLTTTSDMLRDQVDANKYVDIGAGVERHLAVSGEKLKTAVAVLKDEGYNVFYVKVQQPGTGKFTTVKVLAPPGDKRQGYIDVVSNPGQITLPTTWSNDGGKTFEPIVAPKPVNPKRVAVRYAEDGGTDADGVIYVRPGVDDISLGGARYAQVRVQVGPDRFLKGMAVYKDDLPEGVDLMFNTNKKKSATPTDLDAMKPVKDDPVHKFGTVIRQKYYTDANGKKQLSTMNIVNEEGDWHRWSKTLSSQMLSKQSPLLAKEQLGLSYDVRMAEFEEISALTNPTIKRKLLESFADGADSAAVSLKAAGLPRTRNHVLLPVPEIKDGEIYAPNYRDGEKVVLIRHPHGGKFEIPELVVNNRNPAAKKLLGQATDAVGINPKAASQLSGADFDGDTVLVIPNNSGKVKTESPLAGLKDFNPQERYPAYEGMPKMSPHAKQKQMGDVSNLITDMTIAGATHAELARAVAHSMVVIDAEKHNLNYKQSAKDHNIKQLKVKYQNGPRSGAATLISRSSSPLRINARKNRPADQGGAIDRETGERKYVDTGESYEKDGQTVFKTEEVSRMAYAKDARELSSGLPMEEVYADHANRLKALGNAARKEAVNTPRLTYSPSAKIAYAPQVKTLDAKLNTALSNAPLERQAIILAGTLIKAKTQANPDLAPDEIKKIKGQALTEARIRTGANKTRIDIEPLEWEAIQAGAISNSKLSDILDNADLDKIKELATPRSHTGVSPALLSRARAMLAQGHTQADVADAIGVSTSTLNGALKEGE